MKLTPLYNVHVSLGAKMCTTAAGYQMPAHYTTIGQEHQAVRETVGMIDLSLMGRIDIKGSGSLEVVDELAVNAASKLTDGQAMYTTFCNDHGNMIDDVTVWRFNQDHFRVVTSSVMRYKTLKWIQDHLQPGTSAYVTDVSSSLGMIAVQGPRSRDTLQKIVDSDLDRLKFFRFITTKLADTPSTIARLGYSGELGYECYFATEDTVQAWSSIREAGNEFGITPYGLDVLDTLRFEKGFIFFGYEVTEANNPYECGLEKWIRSDKPNFLGKHALAKLSVDGPKRKLVGLELSEDEITPVSQPVEMQGRKIGETVAGFRGLTIGKNLAWAFVETDTAKEGNEVTVNIKGKRKLARIVDVRYYDPKGDRMRM
jgi:aminomethyltransferase